MTIKHILLTLLATLALMGTPAHAAGSPGYEDTDPDIRQGRELTRLLLDGDHAALRARFDDAMQARMSEAALASFRTQVGAQLGEEQSVVSEDDVQVQGLDSYVRMSKWSKLPDTVLTQWVFAPEHVHGRSRPLRPTLEPSRFVVDALTRQILLGDKAQ